MIEPNHRSPIVIAKIKTASVWKAVLMQGFVL